MSEPRMFYVLSIHHTKRRDKLITWWRPNDSGYCFRLNEAGQYTEERINSMLHYYDCGLNSLAIPVDDVAGMMSTIGEVDTRATDMTRSPADPVVPYRHIVALKKSHGARRKRAATLKAVTSSVR